MTSSPETPLPYATLVLTQSPEARDGFTVAYGLSGNNLPDDAETIAISVVDVVMLALVNVLRKAPKWFEDEIALVNESMQAAIEAEAQGQTADEITKNFIEMIGANGGK